VDQVVQEDLEDQAVQEDLVVLVVVEAAEAAVLHTATVVITFMFITP
jgi:hypothetical protein